MKRETRYQAAVIDGTRLLLLQCRPHSATFLRGRGQEDGCFWLLPGGGREEGETEFECVAREAREELQVEVVVSRLLYEMPASPPDGTYRHWRAYQCRITTGEPTPGGGDHWAELLAVRWLSLEHVEEWDRAVRHDPFLFPQLLRIRAALGLTAHARSLP